MIKHEQRLREANCDWGNPSWGGRLAETGEPMDKKRIEGRRDGRTGSTQQSPLVRVAEVNASVVPGSIAFLPGEACRTGVEAGNRFKAPRSAMIVASVRQESAEGIVVVEPRAGSSRRSRRLRDPTNGPEARIR
jgi:hypothetical protein